MSNDGIRITHDQSPTIGALAKALAAAQKAMGNAAKNSSNPHFKSKFADLASVREATEPLNDNGIAVTQQITSDTDGTPGVRTVLMHESGEWVSSTAYCRPQQAGPQALGSVVTYLRRYMLAAAAGIAQEDDDGNEGSGRPGPKRTDLETKLTASVEAAKAQPPKASAVGAPIAKSGSGSASATATIDPPTVTRVQIALKEAGIGETLPEIAKNAKGDEKKAVLRQFKLNFLAEVTGRKVQSSRELTRAEADKVIAKAEAMKKAAAGTTAPSAA